MASVEFMWATVTKVRHGVIAARIEEDLLFTAAHGLRRGDVIELVPDNVYEAKPS